MWNAATPRNVIPAQAGTQSTGPSYPLRVLADRLEHGEAQSA
jgi:hypothetical protein